MTKRAEIFTRGGSGGRYGSVIFCLYNWGATRQASFGVLFQGVSYTFEGTSLCVRVVI